MIKLYRHRAKAFFYLVILMKTLRYGKDVVDKNYGIGNSYCNSWLFCREYA